MKCYCDKKNGFKKIVKFGKLIGYDDNDIKCGLRNEEFKKWDENDHCGSLPCSGAIESDGDFKWVKYEEKYKLCSTRKFQII